MHLKIAIALGIIITVIGGYLLAGSLAGNKFQGDTPPRPGPEAPVNPSPAPSNMKGDTLNRTVNLYYIALEDAGKNGEPVGCNDSLIPHSTNEPLKSDTFEAIKQSLGMLFKDKSRYISDNGLYNSLYQSDLSVDKIDKNGDKIQIYLKGTLSLGGICDTPRFQSQIEETVTTNANYEHIELFLNNEPLDNTLSQSGI